ncbi:pentatricopeptide repeat-containing protein At4g21705, mitochondrial-like [Abrus precatorius]|uniref:Pentatricopeptide repeat-containing protein At4g21705, mitochondrial-like n=1 Tax=Abrus precatorius TaxID=3816 RepID=A0A8B8LJH7_ABRPR|nr:pentatricopeptide repeat-containing protein At4g21705, mitochondrial-like [Abrus precatorius]
MPLTPFFSAIVEKCGNFTANFLRRRLYCSTSTNRRNLYSRISPLGDPSISVVPVLDKWIEEGNAVNGPQLQRIIKILRSRKRFTQALQVSEWMSSKEVCPISPRDEAVQLDLIGRVRGVDSAERYFESVSDGDKTWKPHGALLNCYVREGLVDKSLSQMQKMKEMGFVSSLNYNNIMCLYAQTNQLEKVPGVLELMKEDGVSPDIVSYRICINSYGARSDLVNVEKLLEEMEGEPHIGTDWMTYSMVANLYIKAGLKEKALVCLKKCEDKADKRNAIAYNHLISHYAGLGSKRAMMRLWKLQKTNCKKQLNREYITMLGCLVKLGDLDQAEKVLGEWQLSGNTYDFRVPNILLIGYSLRGLTEKAETLLQSMVEKGKTPTPNSWAIIASGYVVKENMEKAFQCMKEAVAVHAENKGWRPKVDIISSILRWASNNKDISEVEDFVNSLKTVISLNRDMYLSLIKMYVRCGKDVDGILESMKADSIELDEEIKEVLDLRLQ